MRDDVPQRKLDHLRICAEESVQGGLDSGLEQYRLRHNALPGLSLADVETGTRFFGRALRAPLLISPMTGGTRNAREVNLNLARAAQALGLAMGVGSQRAAIEDPSLASTYQVREVAPDILLLANLGAVQLNYGFGLDECRTAVRMIGADALVLHLNPLQEALQAGGNTDFSGLLEKIRCICAGLDAPVIVKEVGSGLSGDVVRGLVRAGVSAVDVAGAGGTSWSQVESHRAHESRRRRTAEAFACWGIPTAEAILEARRAAPDTPIVASGGIGTGPHAATAIALGADMVGIGRPLLAAAMESAESVQEELTIVIDSLRIAMFCAAVPDTGSLKKAPLDCVPSAPCARIPDRGARP